ncbi:efflux RND transporter permease subunit [Pseudomonas sp. 5P_3.1_Bac2]|uniref:efflux RND transporter permease subunit n=1 Tax=Pseudomonas sp. 5P_3.1_Bac2 TaxID=2971617 RepID=UPI0021C5C79D|nr:efflux RND transporter permease subunit [Pseudomonas sp. 5P_3.1_Bac2]MCU1717107.1 efflux RND transporter permease subunit [Pseudomonas sp. 5P_3.1_Bac2]
MNFSQFFIHRPRFAAVLSLLILLAGLISVFQLPISEYPQVVPPTVVVRASYPGANPTVIGETVAAPLEQAITGVEKMLYMSSQANSDGRLTLTVTFAQGTNLDIAQVQVQNRVTRTMPVLPVEVQRLGVTVDKASPDLTMAVHLISPDKRYDMLYLSSYATVNIRDEIARLDGVGDVRVLGLGDYSLRVWLDPNKVASRNLTANDVVTAIQEQNRQVAAGSLGAPPAPGSSFQLSINTQGRLVTEEEFENIIIRSGANGEITRLKDIGRVELGSNQYALRSLLNNEEAVSLAVFQLPGANALDVSSAVRKRMEELKKSFPEGMDYTIVYDPTVFVRGSIEAVVHTLFEAMVLVVLVVIVFLQTWRASLIPLLAVPVSLVGTFAAMHMLGFSLNALSLFGLVLAIGIVVDDAIVVVENVERNIALGLSPVEATIKAMKEVTGPIIATALVLCAVFVPTAFITGLTGEFYQQFALTIAISTVISAFNSLTLSPALAAVLLKGHDQPKDRFSRFLDKILGGWFFTPFNRLFSRASNGYVGVVRRVLRGSTVALIVYAGLMGLTYLGFATTPTGFVPQQDKQYLVGFVQLPDAASLDRTQAVTERMSAIAKAHPGVQNAVAYPGLSINGFTNSPNSAVVFTPLKPFDERKDPSLSGPAIAADLNRQFAEIQDGNVVLFGPPAVLGLGTLGGFRLQLQDRGSLGYNEMYKVTQEVIAKARTLPELNPNSVFTSYQVNVPQLYANIDREKAKSHGIDLNEVFTTLQVYLGSLYTNDFNRFGRTYQVNVQADQQFRMDAEQIGQLKVRNNLGEMVPLASILKVEETAGPDRVMHYNGFLTAEINGAAAQGYSSGQAEEAMAKLLDQELPNGMTYEWTDMTFQKILAGNTAIIVFPICVLLAFLVLAAQYESWSLPLAVILIVPMTLLSAITGVILSGGDNNVFTQIGLIVLVGLACKNAILIVEFAKEQQEEGKDRMSAVLEACRLRLRPILMTSIAFIMGVVPLVLSTGAGAEMRHAMGVAVFSGMLGVTFFGLLLTPVFYVLIRAYVEKKQAQKAALAQASGVAK